MPPPEEGGRLGAGELLRPDEYPPPEGAGLLGAGALGLLGAGALGLLGAGALLRPEE
jgi:hypothetical protein